MSAITDDNSRYGVVIADKKKSAQKAQLATEALRKKSYIQERITYGQSGQGGMGDVHFEYDTVVNQMLVQMYMWGFRPAAPIEPPLDKLAKLVKNKKVPAQYLYGRIEALATEAYLRRRAAAVIGIGAAPTVRAPMNVINPPT